MKFSLRLIFKLCALFGLLFPGVNAGYGQTRTAPCNSDRIDLYPIKDSALQRTVECNVSDFLVALDNDIVTLTFQAIPEDIINEYRTRRRKYNALLVPLPDRTGYQLRGLHLISDEDGVDRLPQLVLKFDLIGNITGGEVNTAEDRAESRRTYREDLVGEQEREVLRRIEQLERAYNQSDANQVHDSLLVALDEAKIIYTVLRNGRDLAREREASVYASNIRNMINRWGELEVTYELINIYRALEEADPQNTRTKFHVTLVQHWFFAEPGYSDTDYIAIEVDLAEPAVQQRRGGRDSYVVSTRPPGVDVVLVDEIPRDSMKTPYFSYNSALQYHYVWVDDTWFRKTYRAAVPNTEEQSLVADSLFLDMEHLDARVKVDIRREDGGDVSGSELLVFDNPVSGFQSGDSVTVGSSNLLNLLASLIGFDSTFYPGPTRDARLEARLENYEPQAKTVTLASPHGERVEFLLQRLKGTLVVASIPDTSQYQVTLTEPAFESTGTTEAQLELEVTGERDPYVVKVWNDAHFPDTNAHLETSTQNYLHYIPEYRTAAVRADEDTTVAVELLPLHVHHKTDKGLLDVTSLDRSEDTWEIQYDLIDHDERNRRYKVTLDLMQGDETVHSVDPKEVTCEGHDQCLGKGLRQGPKTLSWNFAEGYPEIMVDEDETPIVPVLTLRRTGCGWPCALIPAAAGVAAAYIWPRTGSNPSGGFTPPPRPGETQNR